MKLLIFIYFLMMGLAYSALEDRIKNVFCGPLIDLPTKERLDLIGMDSLVANVIGDHPGAPINQSARNTYNEYYLESSKEYVDELALIYVGSVKIHFKNIISILNDLSRLKNDTQLLFLDFVKDIYPYILKSHHAKVSFHSLGNQIVEVYHTLKLNSLLKNNNLMMIATITEEFKKYLSFAPINAQADLEKKFIKLVFEFQAKQEVGNYDENLKYLSQLVSDYEQKIDPNAYDYLQPIDIVHKNGMGMSSTTKSVTENNFNESKYKKFFYLYHYGIEGKLIPDYKSTVDRFNKCLEIIWKK